MTSWRNFGQCWHDFMQPLVIGIWCVCLATIKFHILHNVNSFSVIWIKRKYKNSNGNTAIIHFCELQK